MKKGKRNVILILIAAAGFMVGIGVLGEIVERKVAQEEIENLAEIKARVQAETPEQSEMILKQEAEEEINYAGEKMTKTDQEEARKQIRVRDVEKRAKIEKKVEDNRLKDRLDYLYEIDEVSWVKFERNSVYIGFSSVPSDLTTILGFAAFHGNKAIDFGVHVYAYDACRYGPTTGGNFFKGATCRYGKVKHY